MSEQLAYPIIEPTTFDLVVVGTGLPESVIAAAASVCGKTVLHLDPNPFYGSHASSLSLTDLSSFILSHSSPSWRDPDSPEYTSDGSEYKSVSLLNRQLYSGVEVSRLDGTSELDAESGKFLLDVCGPRAIFASSEDVDLLIKSGCSNYVEFKGIEASFIYFQESKPNLCRVPDSRASIFKDKNLTLAEKNQLMRFFKLVQSHLATPVNSDGLEDDNKRIVEADLDSPFVDFLSKMKLPSNMKSIIMYAIALADYDQEDSSNPNNQMKTKDGIARLSRYQSSYGRLTNTLGALIYPIYGQGELPQSFCRRAAVKGCVNVLRMPIKSLLLSKNDRYEGVKLASGQDIVSDNLILNPSFIVPSHLVSPLHQQGGRIRKDDPLVLEKRVARGICITRSSLKPDLSTLVAVFPPHSLSSKQSAVVRVLQIAGNLAVCPIGMFVLYLSAFCDDIDDGKELINTAINAILATSSSPMSGSEDVKPMLLWSAVYIQDIPTAQLGSVYITPMPDGSLTYSDILNDAEKLFQKIYPTEEFFPASATETLDEDIVL